MAFSEYNLYTNNHVIPIYQRNGLCEERTLNINIFDYGDKLQIKLRDLQEYSFNYTEFIDLGDFEVIRLNQSLDINYSEFKTNIVDMLNQFHRKEMFLKCVLTEKGCSLVFYTKSKIKNIVFLTIDLNMTDQKEIISEMYQEIHQLQDANRKLQSQFSRAKNLIAEKEQGINKLELAKVTMFADFTKFLRQIEDLYMSKSQSFKKQIEKKITTLTDRILSLQRNMGIIKKENALKATSSNNLLMAMERLRIESQDNTVTIESLKKENTSLNILRFNLERNIADFKKFLEDSQAVNKTLERKIVKQENDLKQLSIIVTQKESRINELSKDLVQANNMLVGFNNNYDIKAQQVEELQDALQVKDRLLKDQKCHTDQLLKSYEEYKQSFNAEKFESVRKDLHFSNKRVANLEEEIRKLNKINALLSQKVGQNFFPK